MGGEKSIHEFLTAGVGLVGLTGEGVVTSIELNLFRRPETDPLEEALSVVHSFFMVLSVTGDVTDVLRDSMLTLFPMLVLASSFWMTLTCQERRLVVKGGSVALMNWMRCGIFGGLGKASGGSGR